MFKFLDRHWHLVTALCIGAEAILILGALWLVAGDMPRALLAGTFVAPLLLLSLYINGFYDFEEAASDRREVVLIVRSLAIPLGGLAVVHLLQPEVFPITIPALLQAFALSALFLFGWRRFFRWYLRTKPFSERVIILGADERAVSAAREILLRKHLGFKVLGFLDDDPALQGVSILNPCVIGTLQQVNHLAQGLHATRVLVAQKRDLAEPAIDGLLECKSGGIPVEETATYLERLTGRVEIDQLNKSSFVFSDGFVVPKFLALRKAIFDRVAAAIGLVLAAPLLLLAMIAIKLDSRGPVFYRQERLGLRGRPFMLWKFRSMRTDSEANGARWATQNDNRVTRVGRLLRRCRIDEIPQLINVLKGEMSLVGPRPERQVFVDELRGICPWYDRRLMVKPGLTGWAQIKAPYASTVAESIEKLKYDLYYVKNISFALDMTILASTVRTVLVGRGAR